MAEVKEEVLEGYHKVFPCQQPMCMAELVQMGLHGPTNNLQASPERVINLEKLHRGP